MSAVLNYASCAALWTGLAVKAPDLLRHRHDPYLRAICVVLGLAGLCFFLGAPPTVGAVNRLGGTPNLAAPLTYASITAYGAASQVLVVYWRGGPAVHRVARRWVLAYTGVVVGIAVTFALGEAPVERRTDLDVYYATTPFLAEMIVLYLAGHLAAAGLTAVSALRWARQVDGLLRTGLALLGVGSLCSAGYSVARLVAVLARWTGRQWPVLVTGVSPVAAGLGALITVTGVLLPLAAPRVTRWRRARRTYARLEPLERALEDVLTRRALRLPRPRLASPATRLMWRQTSIHNALGHLDAHLDGDLYDRARRAELRETGDPERARALAWAVIIREAVERDAAGATPGPGAGPGVGPGTGAAVSAAAGAGAGAGGSVPHPAAGAGAVSVGLVPADTPAPDRRHDDRVPLRVPGTEALARVADALAGPLPRASARALAAGAGSRGTP